MKRIIISSGIVAALLLSLVVTKAAHATGSYQYVAKFVCGFDPQDATPRIAPGFYATSIVMLNLSSANSAVLLRIVQTFRPSGAIKKGVQLFALDSDDVKDDGTVDGDLDIGEALQIDCAEILSVLVGGPPYTQGLFIIDSVEDLDVRAIYSVSEVPADPRNVGIRDNGKFLKPVSIDVELIPARSIP